MAEDIADKQKRFAPRVNYEVAEATDDAPRQPTPTGASGAIDSAAYRYGTCERRANAGESNAELR
jgi:hypothetical protein